MTIAPRRGSLALLLHEIDEARAEVQRLRCEAEQQRTALALARRRFGRALEAYAAATEASGLPLPHHIRVELIVYRALGTPDPRRTPWT